MITTRKRLDPTIFDLPVEKMRAGWYTDAYFNHARATLLADGRRPNVVMQVFQKKHSYLGGMDEALAILKLCADGWDGLTVNALYDGDVVEPYETVLTIEGDYTTFAHLETPVLGTLARRTLITTNVVRVLEAANGKPLIFMPARHDHHRVQTGDGYAAYVAGQVLGSPIGVTTDEQASWWGGTGIGTVPHALISAYGGDTVTAAKHFADWAARRHECDSARRLRERLRAHCARGRACARPASLGRAARHVGVARRPVAVGRARRLPADGRQPATRLEGARRARRRRVRAGEDRRLRRLHAREDSTRSSRRAFPSTRTASARR